MFLNGLREDDTYTLKEVVLRVNGNQEVRRAYAIEWNGRGLQSSPVPLCVTVGQLPVRHIQVASDARSAEGILLARPKEGDRLVIHC